jgi:16S rRNA (adenine(1408)-N(1))-methyltransferase
MLTIVAGKQVSQTDAAALRARIAPYGGVTVDLGAGDGRFAYQYGQRHPDRFIIAIDPVRENLRELSAKAARKLERGGAPNVLYVVASIEQMPPELDAVADDVYVTLPWGSLMRGIILGDPAVLAAIARIARGSATIRIVLNTRIFDDPVPIEARDLPEISPEYARGTLAPAFGDAGMRVAEARWMSADEVAQIPTTWAKRLSHRAPPRSLYVEATKT